MVLAASTATATTTSVVFWVLAVRRYRRIA